MSLLENLAPDLGLTYDRESNFLYGKRDDYNLAVLTTAQKNQFQIIFSVSKDGVGVSPEEAKSIQKSSKSLSSVSAINYQLFAVSKAGMTKAKSSENLQEAVNVLLDFLQTNHYQNCDEKTGQVGDVQFYVISDHVRFLTAESYNAISNELAHSQQEESQIKEQLIPGLVGAFLGSLLGVLAIVIIGQLGYVSIFSGVIMGVATVKGYELLGKHISIKSAVICFIIMLIVTYFAIQADLAISIARTYEVSFFEALPAISDLISVGAIETGPYYTNMVLIYLFSIIGFAPTVLNALREKKVKHQTRQLY